MSYVLIDSKIRRSWFDLTGGERRIYPLNG